MPYRTMVYSLPPLTSRNFIIAPGKSGGRRGGMSVERPDREDIGRTLADNISVGKFEMIVACPSAYSSDRLHCAVPPHHGPHAAVRRPVAA